MHSPVFIGIDQGTRSSRSVVVDGEGRILYSSRVALALHEIDQRRVEQDPHEILNSVRHVLDQALQFASESHRVVKAIGIATQRSGVCAWNRHTGAAVSPLLTWADTRTDDMIVALGKRRELISHKTSLPVLAHYAAGKIALLQTQFPDSNTLVGTLDSFLLWHLDSSRPFLTDDTMAARTMVYALDKLDWDSELSGLFGLSPERLASIRASIDVSTSCRYREVPIVALLGDQQAALLGLMSNQLDCLINFGSIVSLLVPTGEKKLSSPGFVTSVLCSQARDEARTFQYLIEGVVNAGGRIVDHLIHEKKYLQSADEIDDCCYRSLSSGSRNALFLPFGGTGSPEWIDNLSILESDRESDRESDSGDDYVRAAVENIGGFVIRQIGILQKRGLLSAKPRVLVSGGLSQSDYLLSFISENCGFPLVKSDSSEATVLGAATASQGKSTSSANKQESLCSNPTDTAGKRDTGAGERYVRWLNLFKKATGKNDP